MTPDPEPGTPDPKPEPAKTPFVVDTSDYQPGITEAITRQWAAAGITHAITKMGGGNVGVYELSTHRPQVAAYRAAGLPCSRYWFNGQDASVASQVLRAGAMLQATPLADGERFMWDVEFEEDKHGNVVTRRWTPAEVEEAARALAGQGIPFSRQVVYLSSSATRAADWSAVVALGLSLMVADYGANSGKPSSIPLVGHWPRDLVWIWQFTSAGRLPGYPYDLDLSTGDLRDLWTVRDLQEALNSVYPDLDPLVVDGDLGDKTTARVVFFQTDHELDPDGDAGPKTLTALADVAG